jgi:hypothetical protein
MDGHDTIDLQLQRAFTNSLPLCCTRTARPVPGRLGAGAGLASSAGGTGGAGGLAEQAQRRVGTKLACHALPGTNPPSLHLTACHRHVTASSCYRGTVVPWCALALAGQGQPVLTAAAGRSVTRLSLLVPRACPAFTSWDA